MNRPLHYIYNISLQSGAFPDEMKIASVPPLVEGSEVCDLGNYCPISVLFYLSKIPERNMYNRLYKYLLNNNNTLYTRNNLDFRKIIQMITQLFN